VSDATATRYLQTLENEGKIKQVGTTGKSVKYARFN
jgi:predicted HTH transcriptional regulator